MPPANDYAAHHNLRNPKMTTNLKIKGFVLSETPGLRFAPRATTASTPSHSYRPWNLTSVHSVVMALDRAIPMFRLLPPYPCTRIPTHKLTRRTNISPTRGSRPYTEGDSRVCSVNPSQIQDENQRRNPKGFILSETIMAHDWLLALQSLRYSRP